MPPDNLEHQSPDAAQGDQADDLEAEPDLGVGPDDIGADCSSDQDERSDESSRVELASHVRLLDPSILQVLNHICEFVDDARIHAMFF